MIVNKIYAIITEDEKGEQGIMALRTEKGWMPLVYPRKDKLIKQYPKARKQASMLGIKIGAFEFSTKEEITKELV